MNTKQELYRNLVKGFDRCRTTAWRQRFLLKPKNCLVPVTWVEIIGGGAVPLSDGLDTRSCKILDPRLKEPALCHCIGALSLPMMSLDMPPMAHYVACTYDVRH